MVEVWQNSQRLANKCEYFNIQERKLTVLSFFLHSSFILKYGDSCNQSDLIFSSRFTRSSNMFNQISRIMALIFYSPSCLGQETAKDLSVFESTCYLPSARLSTTHGEGLCLPHTVPLIAERQTGKLEIPIFIVFGFTRPGIEFDSTASVADAPSTRPLMS